MCHLHMPEASLRENSAGPHRMNAGRIEQDPRVLASRIALLQIEGNGGLYKADQSGHRDLFKA